MTACTADELGRIGRVRAGGVERDVAFADAPAQAHAAINEAHHAKHDRYGPAIVGSVVGQTIRDVTLRRVPREV